MSGLRSPKWKQAAAKPVVAARSVAVGHLRAARGPFEFLAEGVATSVVVCGHDPRTHISGMVHFMLPSSRVDPVLADEQACLFGDLAVTTLLQNLESMGAPLRRLEVWVVGGAGILNLPVPLDIGHKNAEVAQALLRRANVEIKSVEVGGFLTRAVRFKPAEGCVEVTVVGREPLVLS